MKERDRVKDMDLQTSKRKGELGKKSEKKPESAHGKMREESGENTRRCKERKERA